MTDVRMTMIPRGGFARAGGVRVLGLGLALAMLAGCAVTGGSERATRAAEGTGQAAVESEALGGPDLGGPDLGTTSYEPEGVTDFRPTGTFVGDKVEDLRADLQRLQGEIAAENRRLQELRTEARSAAGGYHSVIAGINTRLQVGTTPGNPELVAQWNTAQQRLATIDRTMSEMASLSSAVAGTSALATYLLESVTAAYRLSGAVEEDHRQLAVLEDETNRTVVLIDRLLNGLSEDISRQRGYLSAERDNLAVLGTAVRNGEFYGGSLSNRAYGTPPAPPADGGASAVGQRQPLVVIRFDDETVDYNQPLYNAVSAALERQPNAAFDIVAVAPADVSTAEAALDRTRARRNAERVLRALIDMGLPANRTSLAATTSPEAETNEVHLYLRS